MSIERRVSAIIDILESLVPHGVMTYGRNEYGWRVGDWREGPRRLFAIDYSLEDLGGSSGDVEIIEIGSPYILMTISAIDLPPLPEIPNSQAKRSFSKIHGIS